MWQHCIGFRLQRFERKEATTSVKSEINNLIIMGSNFINVVRDKPFLWDPRHVNFRDKPYIKKVWREVEKECGLDAGTGAKKWKNLKDTYRKQLQRQRISPTKSASPTSKWLYYHDLSFLKKIMEPRLKTQSNALLNHVNIDDEEVAQTESSESVQSVPRRTQRGKTQKTAYPIVKTEETITLPINSALNIKNTPEILENNTQDEEDDYHYLMSFKKYMKNMNEERKLKFRIKMQELVYDILYGDSEQNNSEHRAINT